MAAASAPHAPAPNGRYLATLSLLTLGVVYGDIGTSPLYAVRECFYGPHAVTPTHAHVLGVLSLIFWALVFVVSIKYLVFVLRADNRGEGGILALMSLVRPSEAGRRGVRRSVLLALGLFGSIWMVGTIGQVLVYGSGI